MSTDYVPSPLVEREGELAAIGAALNEASAGSGSAVVIVGESGIGKSSLLRWAGRAGGALGMAVHRTAGTELERAYPYAGVVDLLGRAAAAEMEIAEEGPAALALGILDQPPAGAPGGFSDRRDAGQVNPPDPFPQVYGLYWLTANLAERRPRLLLVDDTQWVDEATLRFLHYLGRRIEEIPVVLVAALLPGEPEEAHRAAWELREEASFTQLRPAPLSERGVERLLVPAGVPTSPIVCRTVRRVSRGNPFLIRELLHEQPPQEIARRAIAGVLDELVPASVERSVQARLRRLGSDAGRVARAVAILGVDAHAGTIARLTELDERRAAAAIGQLVHRVFLEDADPLVFVHPVIRTAVLRGMTLAERGLAHARAARLLESITSPDVVAAHLMEAEPSGDGWVVGRLRVAASRESAGGQPAEAARLLLRALREPPAPDERCAVLRDLGAAEAAAGLPDASAHLREALDTSVDPRDRARISLALGQTLVAAADWAAAAQVFRAGLNELGERDADLAAQLESAFVTAAWVSQTHRAESSSRLERMLDAPVIDPAQRELASWAAFQRANAGLGDAASAVSLVERIAGGASIPDLLACGQTVELLAGVLVTTDALDRELEMLTSAIAEAQRIGWATKYGIYSYCRGWPDLYTGRLPVALADAGAAFVVAEQGFETFYPAACAVMAMALLERGDLGQAERVLDIDMERWGGRVDSNVLLPLVRGRLAAARGDPQTAIPQLRSSGAAAEEAGMHYSALADWRSPLIVALVQAGRRNEARRLAEETLALATAWGARWPLANALRVAGIAAGGNEGIALLREACELADGSSARLVSAWSLAALGTALRHDGRLGEARDVLRRAVAVADECAAAALAERCTSELAAAGARPRRRALSGVESLTPAELRVVRAVLEGRTNREVAQALFVTRKAVEFHLANAYRKLGISSRGELVGVMSTPASVERPRRSWPSRA
jgi:DNA-binding CsgD family transcriptional regulator